MDLSYYVAGNQCKTDFRYPLSRFRRYIPKCSDPLLYNNFLSFFLCAKEIRSLRYRSLRQSKV